MEKLDIGPKYLVSPSQRLANTAILPNKLSIPRSSTLPVNIERGNNTQAPILEIKQVTKEINDFCGISNDNIEAIEIDKRPPGHKVREAWPEGRHIGGDIGDSDSDRHSDHADDDSGIDRSEDFTHDILSD